MFSVWRDGSRFISDIVVIAPNKARNGVFEHAILFILEQQPAGKYTLTQHKGVEQLVFELPAAETRRSAWTDINLEVNVCLAVKEQGVSE
jgi:hypothetical protein